MRRLSRIRFRGAAAVAISLVATFAVLLPVQAAQAATATRIMPFGDSLTEGRDIPGAYRTDLYNSLAAAGYTRRTVLVGTMQRDAQPSFRPTHTTRPTTSIESSAQSGQPG